MQQAESTEQKAPSRFWRKALGVLVLAGAAGGGWLVLGGRMPEFEQAQATIPAEPAKPISVTVTPARIRDVTDQLLVSGTLVARHEILVGPEIDGLRVVEILAEEVDVVTKCAVLARLDGSTLDILLAQNTSSLAKADAAIAQARATIAEAQATEIDAKAAYERVQSLNKSGNSTLEAMMAREASARVATARVNAAEESLRLAEADKTLTEALRRELELRRARTEIKAPEAGIVSQRKIRLGGIAAMTGEPQFRIVADGVMELAADVPETALTKVRTGQAVSVTPAGFVESTTGKVRLVSGAVDAANRQGKAWITLPVDSELKPGLFARGTIDLASRRGVTVPQSAVLFGDEGAYVQVVDESGTVRTRAVRTGIKAHGIIEIREGIAENDRVVARAGGFLRDGDRVTPVERGAGKTS